MNLLHIESRKSNLRNSELEIFVDCDISREQLNDIFPLLKSHTTVLSVDSPDQLPGKEDGMFERAKLHLQEHALDDCPASSSP